MSWVGDTYTLPAGYDIPIVANSALGMQWSYTTMFDIENAFDQVFSLAHSFASTITFNGSIIFNSHWTVAQSSSGISGTNADLANHNTPNMRLTNGALVSVASLGVTGVTTGHQVWLHNDTGNSITIVDQYASAPGTSRKIITTYAADQVLLNQGSVMLEYDSVDSGWRAIAWSGRLIGSTGDLSLEPSISFTVAAKTSEVYAESLQLDAGVFMTIAAGAYALIH